MLTPQTQNKAVQILQALKQAGFNQSVLPVLLGQIAHETAYKGIPFNSPVSQKNNNYSGITFVNQKGATKGTKLPSSETGTKVYYYAKFATIQDWANDYYRILNRGKNPPIKASNSNDFIARLKANKYFADTVENYTKNVNYWLSKFKDIQPTQNFPFLIPLLLLGVFLFYNKV